MKKFLATVALTAVTAPALGQTINYQDFSDLSDFQLNGVAAGAVDTAGRDVLRLTNNYWQAGSAFLTDAVTLTADVSFSSFFEFRFSDQLSGGADGIVFTVQTVSNSVGASGGGIGYQGIPNSVGIEFDNWFNAGVDPDANHVGININGNINSVARTSSIPNLDGGDVMRAWVDYDGVNDLLEVRLSQAITRPTAATLAYSVDLVGVLGQTDAFIGFTSGTGAAAADHDILRWVFNTDFNPIVDPDNPVPAPAALGLVGLGLLSLLRGRRRA